MNIFAVCTKRNCRLVRAKRQLRMERRYLSWLQDLSNCHIGAILPRFCRGDGFEHGFLYQTGYSGWKGGNLIGHPLYPDIATKNNTNGKTLYKAGQVRNAVSFLPFISADLSIIQSGGAVRWEEVSWHFTSDIYGFRFIFLPRSAAWSPFFFVSCSLSVLYHGFPANTTTERLQCDYKAVTFSRQLLQIVTKKRAPFIKGLSSSVVIGFFSTYVRKALRRL